MLYRSGTERYNMALSLRRASVVKTLLVRDGVPENQIVILARGENENLVPTADGVREMLNRRVEIVLE
jgi:outer membrane protein OmpA-like peptidoglycan-associated protein